MKSQFIVTLELVVVLNKGIYERNLMGQWVNEQREVPNVDW